MRLLHLLPIILIISVVTAALKVEERKDFPKELARTAMSLVAGFAGLAVLVILLGRLV